MAAATLGKIDRHAGKCTCGGELVWVRTQPIMKSGSILKCLLAAVLTVPVTGCLARRTVTEGGRTVSQDFVIRRPLKEAVRNSR